MQLEEADPAAFSHVVEWVYHQKVGVGETGDLIKVSLDKKVAQNQALEVWLKNRQDKNKEMEDIYKKDISLVMVQLTERALTYISVWKLADFLGMPKLANYIMRRLINEFDPRKLKHEGGFDFLPLVNPCYDHNGPIRSWILRLFLTGLATVRREGDFSLTERRR